MSISTLSFNSATRTSLVKLQSSLNDASQEVNSGRHVDVGRTLGRLTGSAISARAQESTFKEQRTSNGLVTTRLENIDASLATISEGGEALSNNLVGISVATDFAVFVSGAKSGLQQMTSALNASSGQFLFAGDNSNVSPIKTDTTLADAATQLNFSNFVRAATGTDDASQVTADQMKDYLTNPAGFTPAAVYPAPAPQPTVTGPYKFSDLFTDAAWAANWSNATNGTIDSPVSKSETITSSASANDASFRNMASAYTMITSLDIGVLGESTRKVVTDAAAVQLKKGTTAITSMRADVGTKLKRVESANTELLRQQDIMEKTVSALEDVDIAEASLRVNALKTQLEAAYTVTGKIQSLSLLNYI